MAILQQVFSQEPPVYTKPTTSSPPQTQKQEDRNPPQNQTSPVMWTAGENNTAFYNVNQGLAVSCRKRRKNVVSVITRLL